MDTPPLRWRWPVSAPGNTGRPLPTVATLRRRNQAPRQPCRRSARRPNGTLRQTGRAGGNPKTAKLKTAALERYAFPVFGDARIDRITRADVLAVLTPIWTVKPETGPPGAADGADYVRLRDGPRPIDINPAGEVIDAALPKMPAVKAHFRALPYQEVAAALAAVQDSGASLASAGCFRFLVLTAARSGEARGATWAEIDFDSATWTIPGDRMKSGREHRVPLSSQALEVLRGMLRLQDASDLVFPSSESGKETLQI